MIIEFWLFEIKKKSFSNLEIVLLIKGSLNSYDH